MHAHTYTHMDSDMHIHLPVWVISGFPQWVIEPVLFSTHSLTFPSELPFSVGFSTHRALIHIYWSGDSQRTMDLYVSPQTIVKPQSCFLPFINQSKR